MMDKFPVRTKDNALLELSVSYKWQVRGRTYLFGPIAVIPQCRMNHQFLVNPSNYEKCFRTDFVGYRLVHFWI